MKIAWNEAKRLIVNCECDSSGFWIITIRNHIKIGQKKNGMVSYCYDYNVCDFNSVHAYVMAPARMPQSWYVVELNLIEMQATSIWKLHPFLGHNRIIDIPDCVEFTLKSNACRGFCKSYAFPSPPLPDGSKNPHPIISVATCCSMMETEDVHVIVNCIDGARNLTFKSATQCSCYDCQID